MQTSSKKHAGGGAKTNRQQSEVHDEMAAYHVNISSTFVITSVFFCLALSFAVGRMARILLIIGPQQRMFELQSAWKLEQFRLRQQQEQEQKGRRDVMKLPNPVLKDKPIPQTTYTSMNFNTARSSSINSRWVVIEDRDENSSKDGNAVCDSSFSSDQDCHVQEEQASKHKIQNLDKNIFITANSKDDGDDELHLPAGQHLLMDIRNVQSSFLASEERLAKAMLDVVGNCGLTLLSYHCHGLQPSGVSCVGVLLESHVSFHTWPSKGVITLDLFTCGSQSLLPIVENVERLFGEPANSEGPEIVWAYKVRGFGDQTDEELADLFTFPIGQMTEYKRELFSVEKTTMLNQRIDVYEVLRPVYQNYVQYKRSLRDDGSYESLYKDIFRPDRILFVNGVLQSRRSSEIQYHEALVHPGMFVHKSPSRVLLLNCGGGAALREVLKHKSVTSVVMVDEEIEVIEISKEFFPEYHDCSDILGLNRYCVDDPRVELINDDIYDWADNHHEELAGFDVIVLDDTYYIDDPVEQEEDLEYFLFYLLSSDGILTSQVGDAPSLNTAARGNPNMEGRLYFIDNLRDNGFQRIVDYEESHLGFWNPWQFIMGFKNNETRIAWDYAASSWHDSHINGRVLPTTNGDSSLVFFDGKVMQSYSYRSKASDEVYCRADLTSSLCTRGNDIDIN